MSAELHTLAVPGLHRGTQMGRWPCDRHPGPGDAEPSSRATHEYRYL